MQTFIFRRLIQILFVLVIVSFIAFSLIYIIPGDPAVAILGADAPKEAMENLRAQLGLDKPMIVQYGNWLFKALHGDLGNSIMRHESVTELIAKRLPITLYLGVISLILAAIMGIAGGVLSAVKRGTRLDTFITVLANSGISIPIFWLGILGIYAFALKFDWLPVQGFTFPSEDFLLSTRQAIMPIICLAVVPLAAVTRQMRSAMLEIIQQDYIRTAWSKGLRGRVVILRHALKNSLIPVVALLGTQVRYVIGGSVLVETVFNIPGMGRLTVSGVFDKDFVVIQACVLVTALVIAFANLAVDIFYAYLDPRIRYD